jgi:hypothetical protein
MTIDQKLNLIRRAIELGAKVDMYLHQPKTLAEAKEIEDKLQPLIQVPFTEETFDETTWLEAKDHENNIGVIVFYEKPSLSKGFPFQP